MSRPDICQRSLVLNKRRSLTANGKAQSVDTSVELCAHFHGFRRIVNEPRKRISKISSRLVIVEGFICLSIILAGLVIALKGELYFSLCAIVTLSFLVVIVIHHSTLAEPSPSKWCQIHIMVVSSAVPSTTNTHNLYTSCNIYQSTWIEMKLACHLSESVWKNYHTGERHRDDRLNYQFCVRCESLGRCDKQMTNAYY